MLRIVHVEEIESLLILLPDLVQQQERRCTDFVSNETWLNSLKKHSPPTGCTRREHRHAAKRSRAAEQGQVPPGFSFAAAQPVHEY